MRWPSPPSKPRRAKPPFRFPKLLTAGQLVPVSRSIIAGTTNQMWGCWPVRCFLFLILILLITVAPAAAQNPRPSPTPKTEDQEPVRVFTEEIRLPVSARDSFGHYDPTLNVDDVLVLEDGAPQQIKSIQHLPTNVLLLLDLGNQLGLKDTNLTRQVAMRVVSALYPGNKIAVMQFASQPELLQSWTTDREAVAKVLKTKLKSGKSSRLSDAI